ncbi:MAG: adenine deaminase [Bacteroidota bacterium]
MKVQQLAGNIVNILSSTISPGVVEFADGRVLSVKTSTTTAGVNPGLPFILPGFIDAHVHIESSLLIPSEFARLAVVHGTVATVSDPHEIANVCGVEGVDYMINNGAKVPFKFNFGAPSCVPATPFETAGAQIDAAAVGRLLQRKEIRYLSEMMNFPGVLFQEKEVMEKIRLARQLNKPIDGHAPGLRGEQAQQYINAGISTDHECFTREEALDKLQRGMKIIIREGSAARNFDALIGLLKEYPDQMMFCSDDKHPDSLVDGHINELCRRAVDQGIPLFAILKAACLNPVLHYQLEVGLLQPGDPADFILVRDLQTFRVIATYINGNKVAEEGKSFIEPVHEQPINQFNCQTKEPQLFAYTLTEKQRQEGILVIEALEGQLITNRLLEKPLEDKGLAISDPHRDLLKIAVVNRYADQPPALAFIRNFGLKEGAIASSVAHDSHNIVAVGVDDASLCAAINLVIEQKGGISCVGPQGNEVLPLPVGGLMSADDGYQVAARYTTIDAMAKKLGSPLKAPFMTLSFMALLVIPHLKLSDQGLFDGDAFRLIDP